MVREWLSYVHAGFFCPINHVTKVLPEAATKQFLQVACAPALGLVYHAGRLFVTFKQ